MLAVPKLSDVWVPTSVRITGISSIFSTIRTTSKTGSVIGMSDAYSAGRGTSISTASTISPCGDWQTGAVPNLLGLGALDRLGFQGLNDLFNNLQLWPLNRLLHDLYLWNLHDRVINHLVHRINHSFQLGLTVNHTPVELLVGLGTTSLPTLQELRVHGQTDRMSHSRIVLGDLVGFDTSVSGIFAGFALCLACCKFGKVSVVVAFHLVVKRLRLIGARRSDEFLVRECKDAFTDLLEHSLAYEARCSSPLISPSAQRW